MNRDTTMARWYRRIDSACFSTSRPAETHEDVVPSFNPGFERPLDRWTSIFTAAINADAWRPRHADRPSRILGAALDRTY
jgi:hypothetical protein